MAGGFLKALIVDAVASSTGRPFYPLAEDERAQIMPSLFLFQFQRVAAQSWGVGHPKSATTFKVLKQSV